MYLTHRNFAFPQIEHAFLVGRLIQVVQGPYGHMFTPGQRDEIKIDFTLFRMIFQKETKLVNEMVGERIAAIEVKLIKFGYDLRRLWKLKN